MIAGVNASKFATNAISAVTAVVYGFSVETVSPFDNQPMNLYPKFAVAVNVTSSPSLTSVAEASAVPIVPSTVVTDTGYLTTGTSTKFAVNSAFAVTVTVYGFSVESNDLLVIVHNADDVPGTNEIVPSVISTAAPTIR